MKKPARTSRRGQGAVGQEPPSLTLVLRLRLQELVVATGLIALQALLEEARPSQ